MTNDQIRALKVEGAKKHLLEKAQFSLWRAKSHIDEAAKDGARNFATEIQSAREQINDAELLWQATQEKG